MDIEYQAGMNLAPGLVCSSVGINATSRLPAAPSEDKAYGDLLLAARRLIDRIHDREDEFRRLLRVTANINRGLGLEEVLDFIYQELCGLVPFNRIGFALIDEDHGQVVSRWARSDRPVHLSVGYRAPLAGSTLETIVRTARPRIINDLPDYLVHKPQSRSTELMVREGMRSSLTCPLVVSGRPVGFMFFTSDRLAAYTDMHVEFFEQIAGQLAVIVEKGRLYSELAEQAAVIERQNRQMTKELEIARRLQRALTPQQPPRVAGLEAAFRYESAVMVGGDVLDLSPLPDGKLLAFVGDAMGHGVEAAMLMAAAKVALHAATRETPDPAQIMGRMNRELCGLIGDRFVTAVCCRFDAAAKTAAVALAGHQQPLHVDGQTGELSRPGDAGLPLGVRAEEEYNRFDCPFGPGDVLVLYTDGVTEATDARGRQYGELRLAEIVHRHGRSTAADLLAAVDADLKTHCGEAVRKDDFTLLVIKSAALRT